MLVYHGSACPSMIGTALVPAFVHQGDTPSRRGIYFHERIELARLWGGRQGMTLYSAELDALAELGTERHREWVGVWIVRRPIPAELLAVVERREGAPGTPGLVARIRERALALGTLRE